MSNKKVIQGWCFYDWSNSVYSLVITSAIFPVYYQGVTVAADGSDLVDFFGIKMINSVLYTYALSFSFLVTGLILPILSGVADYLGKKKLMLKIFTYLGGASCIGLFWFDGSNVEFGIACVVLASLGYSGSLVFYDAFLPEIAAIDEYDSISAKGYSYGYVAGVILLVVNIVTIQMHDHLVFLGVHQELDAVRLSFLTVGLWWIGFAQYSFYRLPEGKKLETINNLWSNGYNELRKVWIELKSLPSTRFFLISFFLYNMGVQTIMYLAETFGSKELQMEDQKLIATILAIQLIGILGAYLFAKLSNAKGNKYSITVMLFIWISICFCAYFVKNDVQFYILAVFVGLVMGGIQSLSRATYSKLIPLETNRTASYFSFYDVTFNISIACGTFSFGLVEDISGSMRNSTLVLAIFFVLGLVVLFKVKSPFILPSRNQ